MTSDDALARTAELVERYGWAVQSVTGDRVHPPWAYTVGLTLDGLPELVVTGLVPGRAGVLLDDAAQRLVRAGGTIGAGESLALGDGRAVRVVEVALPEAHLVTATALCGDQPITALQLVWSDDRDRWPWDARFRGELPGGQPVLGPRSTVPSG